MRRPAWGPFPWPISNRFAGSPHHWQDWVRAIEVRDSSTNNSCCLCCPVICHSCHCYSCYSRATVVRRGWFYLRDVSALRGGVSLICYCCYYCYSFPCQE